MRSQAPLQAVAGKKAEISRLKQLVWGIAGADPALIASCPLHERIKFFVISLLHCVIAILVGAFTARALVAPARDYLRVLGFETVRADTVALVFGCVVVLISTKLLAIGMRWFTTRGEVHNTTVLRPELEPLLVMRAILPGIGLTAFSSWIILGGMFGYRSASPQSQSLVFFTLSFQLLVCLSPLLIASAWPSAQYDRLLAAVHASTAAAASGATNSTPPSSTAATSPSIPAGTTSVPSEYWPAIAGLQDSFNRNPRNSIIGRALIDQLRAAGALLETLPVFDALASADPANADLLKEKASIYQQLGDDARYRRTLEQVDEIHARASFEQNAGKPFVLTALQIQGLAFFADFTWKLQPGLNILLGKNGYGKSHLLRAMVAAAQCNDRILEDYFQDSNTAIQSSNAAPRIRVDAVLNGNSVSSTARPLRVFDDGSFGKVPVLAIPDVRYVDKSRTTIGAPADQAADLRSEGARHLLLQIPYEGLVLNFLYELCLDYLEHRRSFNAPLFRLIEDSINYLARPLAPSGAAKREFAFHEIRRHDNARFEILVRTDGNDGRPLSLQKASQGTLSVVAMIGIVYKFLRSVHQGVPEEEIRLQQALVVIDEIDAHLHPSWQQRTISLFRDTLPNVQFVLTAHSPLVVAGAREGETAVLRPASGGFQVEVFEGHFIGATAASMYRRVFEIEEKDSTYLKLGTLHVQKSRIESEVERLEQKPQRSPSEEEQYEKLSLQLGDLLTFETARDQRERSERLENRNQDLEVQVLSLEGQVEQLSGKLQEAGQPQ